MKPRSAIKPDLFADELHHKKIETLRDPLAEIESRIDFVALAAEMDRNLPRPVSAQEGRSPYPTETMVRILVLKRSYNLSDEQMEYQLLDRMSYKRFCGLQSATTIPDRTTVWTFENRIGEAGAKALFDGFSAQLLQKGFITRGGQVIKQHASRGEKVLVEQGTMPARSGARRTFMQPGPRSTARATSVTSCRWAWTRNTSPCARSRPPRRACTTVSISITFSTRPTRAGTSMPTGATRLRSVKENGFRDQMQRKGHRNMPLSDCQQGCNKRIAKARARVEHVFGAIEQMGGKLLRTAGQARANFAMTMMAACYNLKRLVHFQKAGVKAF